MNINKTIKLYPLYKLFAYDVLFYYSISILYLTAKGLSLSQIALLSSIYSFSSLILQLPATIIVDKLGTRNSMILGNLFCTLWGIIVLFSNSFIIFGIAEFITGFGFAIKGVAESPYIYRIMKKANKVSEYAKVESKGSTLYFVIEAIACIVAGILYIININLPIIFATICSLIALIIASFLSPLKNSVTKTSTTKEYFSDLKDGFKFIFNSKRLHALLIFSCVFYGVVSIGTFFMKAYLQSYNVSSSSFGIIYAILAVSSAVGCSIQDKIENRYKNRTLSFYSITYVSTFLFISVLTLLKLPINALIILGTVFFVVQAILKGSYRIIIKQYLSRYTNNSIRTKIMSIYYLVEALGSAGILYLASLLVDKIDLSYMYFLFGTFLLISFMFILIYMKPRVGRKPEEYSDSDRSDIFGDIDEDEELDK